jgi:hypothetical protein
MAIEGPLRELGIHDVFQLLDLSRKTGVLRVNSALRDNEGTVYFAAGRVVHASIRSNPHPLGTILLRAGKITEADLERARSMQVARPERGRLGEILVEIGAVSQRELERQARFQIEAVVFELMSWREGFFSFEEGKLEHVPAEASVVVQTESLLMEGARRIDEWSRIEDKVPNLGMVPVLAPERDGHSSMLDLLPHEWEMLTMIDGGRNLRTIATEMARSEFDVAKIAYGLVSTGVVELRDLEMASGRHTPVSDDPTPHLVHAAEALSAGRSEEALTAARQAIAMNTLHAEARVLAARALTRLGRHGDAVEELRRARQMDAGNPAIELALGYAAAREGDLQGAVDSWTAFLQLRPGAEEAGRVRAALECAEKLATLIAGAEQ